MTVLSEEIAARRDVADAPLWQMVRATPTDYHDLVAAVRDVMLPDPDAVARTDGLA